MRVTIMIDHLRSFQHLMRNQKEGIASTGEARDAARAPDLHSERPLKRIRNTRSCDNCRKSKVRCDWPKPVEISVGTPDQPEHLRCRRCRLAKFPCIVSKEFASKQNLRQQAERGIPFQFEQGRPVSEPTTSYATCSSFVETAPVYTSTDYLGAPTHVACTPPLPFSILDDARSSRSVIDNNIYTEPPQRESFTPRNDERLELHQLTKPLLYLSILHLRSVDPSIPYTTQSTSSLSTLLSRAEGSLNIALVLT